MSKLDYEITSISFSSRTDVVGENTDEYKSPEKCKRVTTIVAHVSYLFKGLNNSELYSTAVVDLATVCTVNIDEEGNLLSIEDGDFKSVVNGDKLSDEAMSKINDVIEKSVKSYLISSAERSSINSAISSFNSLDLPKSYKSAPGIGDQS